MIFNLIAILFVEKVGYVHEGRTYYASCAAKSYMKAYIRGICII